MFSKSFFWRIQMLERRMNKAKPGSFRGHFFYQQFFSTVGFLWIWNLGRTFSAWRGAVRPYTPAYVCNEMISKNGLPTNLVRTPGRHYPLESLPSSWLVFQPPIWKKYQIGNNFGGPKFLLASKNSNFKKHLKNPCSTTAMGLGLVSQNNSVGKSFHYMKKLGT